VVDSGAGRTLIDTTTVSSTSKSGKGGQIIVTGRQIQLKAAQIAASGANGGGKIEIGGSFQGKGPVANALTTEIDANTTIDASATDHGRGGDVVVWSDDNTRFSGLILANGGANGGDGGTVEVSGKAHLGFAGLVTTLAAKGQTGSLLLDPYNVTISTNADSNQTGFTATGSGSNINVTTLQNQLAGSNVTVSTGASGAETGNITVSNAITWSANTTLTLNAAEGIILNANITNSGTTSGLSLVANGTGAISGAGTLTTSGTLTLNVVNATGAGTLSGAISGAGALIKSGPGTTTLSAANTYSGTTTISAGTLALTSSTSSSAFTVNSGATLQVGSASDFTFNPGINSSISGAGTLQKVGAGNLTFASVNSTFTWAMAGGGLIDVQAGMLTGGSNIKDFWTTNSSSLNVASGATFAGVEANVIVDQITGSGTIRTGYNGAGYTAMTIGVNNGSSTFSGSFVNTDGANWGNLVKAGTGTITLSSVGSYMGTTNVTGGTLALGSSSSSFGFTVNSGATLQVGSGLDFTFNPTANSSISGAGTLRKVGVGNITFAGNYSFTWQMAANGLIDVQAGTLTGGSNIRDFWTSNLSSLNVASGAAFDGVEANVRVDQITGSGAIRTGYNGAGYTAMTIGVNNGSSTFDGTIASTSQQTGNIVKAGAGTIILTGANTHTGTTTISSGTLQVGNGGTTGSLGSGNIVNNGTLIFSRSDAISVSAAISGTGALTQAGSGTTTLSGANTYSGTTTVNTGNSDSFWKLEPRYRKRNDRGGFWRDAEWHRRGNLSNALPQRRGNAEPFWQQHDQHAVDDWNDRFGFAQECQIPLGWLNFGHVHCPADDRCNFGPDFSGPGRFCLPLAPARLWFWRRGATLSTIPAPERSPLAARVGRTGRSMQRLLSATLTTVWTAAMRLCGARPLARPFPIPAIAISLPMRQL